MALDIPLLSPNVDQTSAFWIVGSFSRSPQHHWYNCHSMRQSDAELNLSDRERRRLLFSCQQFGRAEKVDAFDLIRDLVAIQTQYAQSFPTSLAVRGKRASDAWAQATLAAQGPIVKTWSVRSTLHTLHNDMDALIRCVNGERQLMRHRLFARKYYGFDEAGCETIDARLLDCLGEGPKTRAQLHDAVPEFKGLPMTGWGGDLFGLAAKGVLGMCSHLGTTLFFRREPNIAQMAREEAAAAVLQAYLAAFGSATMQDFAFWSAFKAPDVRAAFALLMRKEVIQGGKENRPVYVLNAPKRLDRLPPICLSAKFDSLIMGHADRSFYLRPEWEHRVSRKAGQIEACVFKQGEVAGTWRMKRTSKGLAFTVEAWENLPRMDYQSVEQALNAYANAVDSASLSVDFIGPTV